eukprot:TRINITY_DN27389_c0_g1_i1.p1 TRINITY_DN27389_c0_g1~~TRINITY_DN27389_c0_g1_i1.p1  ORF type:complete len:467 (+),score=108.17 TRINITY_DN27389_c0_g1_i1:104-1402(+)
MSGGPDGQVIFGTRRMRLTSFSMIHPGLVEEPAPASPHPPPSDAEDDASVAVDPPQSSPSETQSSASPDAQDAATASVGNSEDVGGLGDADIDGGLQKKSFGSRRRRAVEGGPDGASGGPASIRDVDSDAVSSHSALSAVSSVQQLSCPDRDPEAEEDNRQEQRRFGSRRMRVKTSCWLAEPPPEDPPAAARSPSQLSQQGSSEASTSECAREHPRAFVLKGASSFGVDYETCSEGSHDAAAAVPREPSSPALEALMATSPTSVSSVSSGSSRGGFGARRVRPRPQPQNIALQQCGAVAPALGAFPGGLPMWQHPAPPQDPEPFIMSPTRGMVASPIGSASPSSTKSFGTRRVKRRQDIENVRALDSAFNGVSPPEPSAPSPHEFWSPGCGERSSHSATPSPPQSAGGHTVRWVKNYRKQAPVVYDSPLSGL